MQLLSSWYTYATYIDWQANPTITVINTTSYPIKNVEYPAITICSQGLAKDIVETVFVQQFESYLVSKSIIEKPEISENETDHSDVSKKKTWEGLTNNEVITLRISINCFSK